MNFGERSDFRTIESQHYMLTTPIFFPKSEIQKAPLHIVTSGKIRGTSYRFQTTNTCRDELGMFFRITEQPEFRNWEPALDKPLYFLMRNRFSNYWLSKHCLGVFLCSQRKKGFLGRRGTVGSWWGISPSPFFAFRSSSSRWRGISSGAEKLTLYCLRY